MNKSDLKLLIISLIFAILLLVIINYNHGDKQEVVAYYEDKEVLRVPLTTNQTYEVTGLLGPITIEVADEQVRVVSETSPLHLCSKQGYISKAYQSLICLPNKVVIKIVGASSLDAVVS